MKKAIIAVRLDQRTLAQIAAFYETKGRAPGNLTAVVSRALADFSEILVAHGSLLPTYDEAFETLARLGYNKLERAEAEEATKKELSSPPPARSQKDANREIARQALERLRSRNDAKADD